MFPLDIQNKLEWILQPWHLEIIVLIKTVLLENNNSKCMKMFYTIYKVSQDTNIQNNI